MSVTSSLAPGGASGAAAPLHTLDRLERGAFVLTRPIAFLGVIGMLVASGTTVIDVLLRWLANSGVSALNEIVALAFAVAVTACIPSGLAGGVNLTIDLLQSRFTHRLSAWLQAIGALLLLVFFALLSWRIAVYAVSLADRGATTVIRGFPQAPFFFVAAGLVGIGVLVQALVTANLARKALATRNDSGPASSPLLFALSVFTGVAIVAVAVYALFDFAGLARWAQANPGTMVLVAFALLWLGDRKSVV